MLKKKMTFDYRFGNNLILSWSIRCNIRSILIIKVEEFQETCGGIMNAVPRQGYFLGKIVKGVGKAIGSVADAAGKVLKSDVR